MIPQEQRFQIGPFTFSRAQGLYRGRRSIPLRHVERQLLKCLLDRAGEIVRRDEIQAVLWPDTSVASNTLNVHVRRLRVTLGDVKKPYRLLKSFSRIGLMIAATPQPKRLADQARTRAVRDRSRFVRDVTVPDGSIMEPGERFEKVWEIENAGSVRWHGRHLRRVGVESGQDG